MLFHLEFRVNVSFSDAILSRCECIDSDVFAIDLCIPWNVYIMELQVSVDIKLHIFPRFLYESYGLHNYSSNMIITVEKLVQYDSEISHLTFTKSLTNHSNHTLVVEI